MTKDEIKHRDELHKAKSIILELGFIPDKTMCGDRPDILLPSVDNRKIGIEVVTYSTHHYEEAEEALYKILNEYTEERLDKRSEKRYEIGISFMDLSLPSNLNYKKIKKQIFEELDNLLLPMQPEMNRQYIDYVVAMENPGVTHSFISCDSVVVYEPLNEEILLKCINQKEQKLKEYKTLKENSKIKEYYLVVFFPINEHAEIRGYTLPKTFKTEFDRIDLVDLFYTNRIV